jgi:hypothetical protein
MVNLEKLSSSVASEEELSTLKYDTLFERYRLHVPGRSLYFFWFFPLGGVRG